MLFPLRFDPSALQGSRAKQHTNRPDAFQQLVGDALREEFGFRVSVSPTKGRDGAIDAFIDDKNGVHALANLPAPQIIECKDHDDSCADLQKNIIQGWDKVAKKLKEQAEAGWAGDFEPWRRVKSYVYCISSNIGKQASREKLEEKIIYFFFDELSDSTRPPLLEEILVLDWSDLQNRLNRFPRIADKWIGLQLPKIQSHAEYCESLTQFRRYLLEENFPFVPPENENINACPANILDRLEKLAGTGGILLKGIGGVGKTRTALEVAQLADENGWRVLHLLPGDPGVTADDLSEVLFSGNEKTLLVFDYLDQMPKLDLGSLHHRILPEAAKREMQLALLANLRLSSLRNRDPERDALFTEQILLQTSASQKARIKEIALERIAPLAVAQLGHEKVHELCGERPIIAMFIAEELQRRAKEGILEKTDLSVIRNNNLTGWMKKRLIEDKLVASDNGNSFLPPQPEPWLISAASMLAVAPLARDHMEEAGRKAFLAAGGDNSQMATHVLDHLLTLGWIEHRGIELSASHDVVADEVFNEVLRDRISGQLRDGMLDCCLTPALGRARTLGRYATALNRLQGAEKTEPKAETNLHEKAGTWLSKHCSELGQMLAATEAGESAYALGNIISTPGWATVCITEWSQLVAPWLKNHSLHHEARHLLYRGLKELSEGNTPELINTALNWLPHHLNSDTASYVLGPLLNRKEINTKSAVRTIEFAMQWLASFGHSQVARFVLPPLLKHNELGIHADKTINIAIQWLVAFGLTLEAQFVLAPLLARKGLDQLDDKALDLTFRWLDAFGLTQEAGFVLAPLLARKGLDQLDDKALDLTFRWLDAFGLTQEAGFVLAPLLARKGLDQLDDKALDLTFRWLDAFGLTIEAQFVLAPLLARKGLDQLDDKALDLTFRWLDAFGLTIEAGFVLAPLLARKGLDQLDDKALDLTFRWLDAFGLTQEARFVLAPLLARKGLDQLDDKALDLTFRWLDAFGLTQEAGFVLAPLLARKGLDQLDDKALDLTFRWLDAFGLTIEAQFVLAPLLARKGLDQLDDKALDLTFRWLDAFGLTQEARFVLAPLLARKGLDQLDDKALDLTFRWLDAFGLTQEARFVLAPLLARKGLDQLDDKALDLTFRWLDAFGLTQEAGFVLAPLLARKGLDQLDDKALDLTFRWLDAFGLTIEAGFVLDHLLKHNEIGSNSHKAIDLSFLWLDAFGLTQEAGFVFHPLLKRNNLGEYSDNIINHALQWLDTFLFLQKAQFVFAPLLTRNDLNKQANRAIKIALTWIGHYPLIPETRFVLKSLLTRNDLGSNSILIIKFTKNWLDHFSLFPQARFVYDAILARYDLEKTDRIRLQELFNRLNKYDLKEIDKKLTLAALGQIEKPDEQVLEKAIEEMSNTINTSRPAAAAFLLPGLLAIIQPLEQADLWNQVIKMAKQILAHPKFLPKNKAGLAKSIWYLVDQNAWPEELAKPVLEELELERPSSDNQSERAATGLSITESSD